MFLLHNLISTDIVRYIRIPGECLLQLQSECTHINKSVNCGTNMPQIWQCRILWTTGAFQHSFRVHNFNTHFAWRLAFTSVYNSSDTPTLCRAHTYSYPHIHTHTQTPQLQHCYWDAGKTHMEHQKSISSMWATGHHTRWQWDKSNTWRFITTKNKRAGLLYLIYYQ